MPVFRCPGSYQTLRPVLFLNAQAYFAVAEGGFSYQLSATNTDNTTHTSSEVKYIQVLSGKLYTMTYSFADDAATGGVEIEITDDMDVTDEDVNL